VFRGLAHTWPRVQWPVLITLRMPSPTLRSQRRAKHRLHQHRFSHRDELSQNTKPSRSRYARPERMLKNRQSKQSSVRQE
jgi:hypothetical protein